MLMPVERPWRRKWWSCKLKKPNWTRTETGRLLSTSMPAEFLQHPAHLAWIFEPLPKMGTKSVGWRCFSVDAPFLKTTRRTPKGKNAKLLFNKHEQTASKKIFSNHVQYKCPLFVSKYFLGVSVIQSSSYTNNELNNQELRSLCRHAFLLIWDYLFIYLF